MLTDVWKSRLREYGPPTLLILAIGPIWIAIWGDLNILGFGLGFLLAFVTSMVLRPQSVWVTPVAVVLIMAIVVYVLELLSLSEPARADLVGNVMLIPLLMLVPGLELLVCTWLGRELGSTFQARRGHGLGRHVPSS